MTHPSMSDDEKIRAGLEQVEAMIAEEIENAEDEPDADFAPGDPDFEGINGMADVFRFCVGAEADLVPAELRAAVARAAWGLAESMKADDALAEEFDAEQRKRQGEREADEQRRAALMGADEIEVRLYREGSPDVYVGPYRFHFEADNAASYFRGVASRDDSLAGYMVEVLPFTESRRHLAGMIPKSPETLAGLIELAQGERDLTFPSLFDRLLAFHGEAGRNAWDEAIALLNPERVDAVIGN